MPKLRSDLEERGFTLTTPSHTHFQAKKETLSCTVYLSGKMTVQGKGQDAFIEFILPDYRKDEDYTPHIGGDEAGKGDFFGPLSVSAVFVDPENAYFLKEMGVRDSKDLSDGKVEELARIIEKKTLHHTICLFPVTYNKLYKRFNNLNKLLAWAHFEAVTQVAAKSKCSKILIDQFAHQSVIDRIALYKNSSLDIEQKTHAESDIAVAAASILARSNFLDGLRTLSEKIGIELPKGASSAVKRAGRKILEQMGLKDLEEVSKTHFKTFKEIVDEG